VLKVSPKRLEEVTRRVAFEAAKMVTGGRSTNRAEARFDDLLQRGEVGPGQAIIICPPTLDDASLVLKLASDEAARDVESTLAGQEVELRDPELNVSSRATTDQVANSPGAGQRSNVDTGSHAAIDGITSDLRTTGEHDPFETSDRVTANELTFMSELEGLVMGTDPGAVTVDVQHVHAWHDNTSNRM
jgi:hypothetical protein